MSKELVKRILSSIILLPLVFYFLTSGSFLLILFIVLCFIITFYEWNKMSKNKFYKIFGFIFLLFSFYTFYHLSIELFLLIYAILICISTDIGGYIFGKFMEGLFEGSPQSLFQLFIVLKNSETHNVMDLGRYYFSISISVINLALASVFFEIYWYRNVCKLEYKGNHPRPAQASILSNFIERAIGIQRQLLRPAQTRISAVHNLD